MAQINPEDLILVNRDGVDYQAKVEDLPDSGTHWDDIEGKPCIPECHDCQDCLEAECTYIGTKNPQELIDWLGDNWGYGYADECISLYKNYSDPQDIFDIYIPDGHKNPFCINAFDRCFVGSPSHLHYRLADGSEGTFQTEIRKRTEFPDGKAHIRIIPIEKDILPKDEAFKVWIDIDEEPDTLTCQHPDHNDWVYWDNVVGVPEDLQNQQQRLQNLPRVFGLKDDDLILISRPEGRYTRRDFAIEAQHAKTYFHESIPAFDDGRPHLHVINGPTKMKLEKDTTYYEDGYHMWDVDGNYIGRTLDIEPNQEVIIGLSEDAGKLFYYEKQAEFAIGPKTDTSKCTSFGALFMRCEKFTGEGVEYIDVSNANALSQMFYGCDVFNGDVSGYNPSKCTFMGSMFKGCYVFNQDISNWDVSNCTDFYSTFENAKAFNQDVRSWNTQKATDLRYMFYGAGDDFKASDNSDLSQWCVPNANKYSGFGNVKAEPVWGTCPRGEDHPGWIDTGN